MYVAQYNIYHCVHALAVSDNRAFLLDAAACRKAAKCCRYSARETPTLVPQQNQAPNQCRSLDTRRSTMFDLLKRWRVYPLEWHGL